MQLPAARNPAERQKRPGSRRLVAVARVDVDFQRFHEVLAAHFSREEIPEIIAVVVDMNVWTRIKLAEGAMPAPV